MASDLQLAWREIVSLNPATGEVLRVLECANVAEVCDAVTRARAAQNAWSELGVGRRVAVIREFQSKLHARKSEIAAAITREAGKPLAEAITTEVLVVLDAAPLPDRERRATTPRRTGAARQPSHKAQARTPSARTSWRNRDHLSVELPVLDSGNRDTGGSGRWERSGAEAVGIDAACGVGAGAVTA